MGFEVFALVIVQTVVFWFVILCSHVGIYCGFGRICCLLLQGSIRLGYIGRLEERPRFEPGTCQIEAGMDHLWPKLKEI